MFSFSFSFLAISYQLLLICPSICEARIYDVSSQLLAAGGNRTTLREQIASGFASNASYRGTLDIVWSCVLTLTACIYTALHLNIPSSTWRKILWAAIALLAPELILFTALNQFIEARSLIKKLNEKRSGMKQPPPNGPKTSKTSKNTEPPPFFYLRYGFYVTMGGFTVDVEKLHKSLSRVTLTISGITKLAEQGCFFDIDPETISNKSQANVITKLLVCIQVSWMVVQCIARKAVGYPLTLLEIHTMVHVVCALTLYILWWEKPLDIREPTILDPSNDAKRLEIIAHMLSKNFADTGHKINTVQEEGFPAELTLKSPTISEFVIADFQSVLFDDVLSGTSITAFISAVLFPAVYGGIHLAAWGFEFPSRKESVLWKISCLIIIIGPLIFILMIIIVKRVSGTSLEDEDLFLAFLNVLFYSLVIALLAGYVVARIFIVIESFLSLRHVPIGVYAAVPWVQNIPHI